MNSAPRKRMDLDPQHSDHSGLLGLYEVGFRRFKTASTLLTLLPMYVVASICIGLALTPSVALFELSFQMIREWPFVLHVFGLGVLVAGCYFIFGFTLLFVIPIFNVIMMAKPKPWRGPYYSLVTVKWGIHNGLTYLARYLFLEFATPTPLNVLFYRMMGMQVGANAQINTSNISDPSLISIGAKTTIGGSATLVAHYGQGGFLVIAPLKIGANVTVGLQAVIMGDVEIGDGAKILPNSTVMPKTRIPAGETWGGVPARKLS